MYNYELHKGYLTDRVKFIYRFARLSNLRTFTETFVKYVLGPKMMKDMEKQNVLFFSEHGGHVSSEVGLYYYIQASLIPHEVNKFRKSYIQRQLMANYRMLANAPSTYEVHIAFYCLLFFFVFICVYVLYCYHELVNKDLYIYEQSYNLF